ncbi:MAG: hypothetical protein IPL26_21505 [Leptospiraceae bacterium]|nr:hypothetical protein [Leptospiraceae bacterium]
MCINDDMSWISSKLFRSPNLIQAIIVFKFSSTSSDAIQFASDSNSYKERYFEIHPFSSFLASSFFSFYFLSESTKLSMKI